MCGEGQVGTPSAQNGHAGCLVCGYTNPWSLGMRFEPGPDGMVCGHFRGNEGLQGYQGMLHGGVLAALLDSAMVHCLFHRGVRGVTGDLHVRFVQPVPCRSDVDVRARVVSATPPLHYLKAEILDGERVMAWGEATFMQCDRRGGETGPGA